MKKIAKVFRDTILDYAPSRKYLDCNNGKKAFEAYCDGFFAGKKEFFALFE